MKLNQSMPFMVKVGEENLLKCDVYGGRYMDYDPKERRLVGVKMAVEINHTCVVSIPTKDFSVPSHEQMVKGIRLALWCVSEGNDLYAGCMGGSGRTGTFMGCLAKVMADSGLPVGDPVDYVRKHYRPHAIETKEQEAFVRGFDTTEVMTYVAELTRKEVVVERVEYVRVSFWQSVRDWLCKMW